MSPRPCERPVVMAINSRLRPYSRTTADRAATHALRKAARSSTRPSTDRASRRISAGRTRGRARRRNVDVRRGRVRVHPGAVARRIRNGSGCRREADQADRLSRNQSLLQHLFALDQYVGRVVTERCRTHHRNLPSLSPSPAVIGRCRHRRRFGPGRHRRRSCRRRFRQPGGHRRCRRPTDHHRLIRRRGSRCRRRR